MAFIDIDAGAMCEGCPALKGISPENVQYIGGVICGGGGYDSVASSTIVQDAVNEKKVELIAAIGFVSSSVEADAITEDLNEKIGACAEPRKRFLLPSVCAAGVISRKVKPFRGVVFDSDW